jgi:cytochrome b subunit of formate dehydrogenase
MSVQIQRRDLMQVAYHWLNAAAIAALLITGLAIYSAVPGTDFYFASHLWGAWVFLIALIFHIWHDTVVLKNFRRMWMSGKEIREAINRARIGNGGPVERPPIHGHYKLEQIAFHWILTAVLLGIVMTGFILWKPGRIFVAPLWMPFGWDAVYVARLLHQFFTFILIAMIIAHVYFAVLVPKNWPLLKSIFTGRVLLSWYATEHRISPRLQSWLQPTGGSEKSNMSGGVMPEGRKG